jgi:hypothetical protein
MTNKISTKYNYPEAYSDPSNIPPPLDAEYISLGFVPNSGLFFKTADGSTYPVGSNPLYTLAYARLRWNGAAWDTQEEVNCVASHAAGVFTLQLAEPISQTKPSGGVSVSTIHPNGLGILTSAYIPVTRVLSPSGLPGSAEISLVEVVGASTNAVPITPTISLTVSISFMYFPE